MECRAWCYKINNWAKLQIYNAIIILIIIHGMEILAGVEMKCTRRIVGKTRRDKKWNSNHIINWKPTYNLWTVKIKISDSLGICYWKQKVQKWGCAEENIG